MGVANMKCRKCEVGCRKVEVGVANMRWFVRSMM